ncbi:SpaA isopeptide-forming pilin-related protein [Fructobacillus tropaeoli]|uniref:SpaA isopeptide-forming pilin-related protein n=1 Tax=Fructobacillus tropaeoli TaxID=709323 RepID=UPI002DA31902|nr:Clumping factor A-related surface protein [Fructobacillus tropaeoli]
MGILKGKEHYKLYKDGKHWVTTMIAGAMLISGLGLISQHNAVSADDLANGGQVSFAGKDGTVSFSDGSNEPVMNIRMGSQATFCINPFVIVHSGALATQVGQNDARAALWSRMTSYQRGLINNVAWVGQSQGAANDPATYYATQVAMWSLLAGQNGIPGMVNENSKIDSSQLTNVLDGRTVTGQSYTGAGDVAAKAAQILDNAASLSQSPTFNPAPLNIVAGKSGTIDTTNGVDLSKFQRITSDKAGVTASANGTQLVVNTDQSAQAGNATFTLNTGRNTNGVNYIYGTVNPDGSTGQTLYGSGDPSRMKANVSVNVVKANLKIDKNVLQDNGQVNKHLTNDNYSLAGNVFEVHKDTADGPVVKELTTDANGNAETGSVMDYGHYIITEKQASQGLANTFAPIAVDLDENGQRVQSVSATNKEVRGSTSVIKQDKQTGGNSQGRATFSGAEYTLYHADGTPVKWSEPGQPIPEITSGQQVSRDQVTLRIDDNLHEAGVKNLALGDYYWQETKAPEGYQLDGQKYNVAIKYQDQDTPVITQNETSKEQVINFSFDGFKYVQSPSGKSQSGYNGIQLSLIPINGTKGDKQTVTTDTDANGYDGYYKFNNISYGDYELWEENSPEGYQHIEPLYVHIELNANKTAYVFTVTEKGQSVPLKKMTIPVTQINAGSGNVYLSKLFLFDKSEDTRKCNGGGNNQPVINITNNPVITNTNEQHQNQQQQQTPQGSQSQKQDADGQRQAQQPTVAPIATLAAQTAPVTPKMSALPQTGKKTADNPTKLYLAGLAVLAGVGLGSWQRVQRNNRKRKRLAKVSGDLKKSAV